MYRFKVAFMLWKNATMYHVELKLRSAAAYLAGVSLSSSFDIRL
jgi:hypothetical protein